MSAKSFFISLILVSVCTAVLIHFLSMNEVLAPNIDLAWLSLTIFIILTISIYGLALYTNASPNPNHFTLFFLGVVFFKILMCGALIFVYQMKKHPQNKYFVAPFLIIYLIFTVFEVIVMTRVNSGKRMPKKSK